MNVLTRLMATLWARVAVVVLFLAAMLLLAVWTGFDFNRLFGTVARIDALWAVTALVAFAAAQLLFALRWGEMLAPTGHPGYRSVLRYMLIGNMLNIVLPMRAGDVTRAVMLSRRHGIRLGDAAGTVAIERIADAATVCLLAAYLATRLTIPQGSLNAMLAIGVALAVIAIGLLGLRAAPQSFLVSTAQRLLPEAVFDRSVAAVGGLRDSIARLRTSRVLMRAGVAHVLGWVAVAGAMSFMLASLSIDVPHPDAEFAVLALTGLGSAVIQVPAGIGSWHVLAATALALWQVPMEQGIAFALVAHGIGVVVPTLGGAIAYVINRRTEPAPASAAAAASRE